MSQTYPPPPMTIQVTHTHEPIMYSSNNIYKLNEIPHQCLFKAGISEINETQEYFDFLHTYCDANHARYLTDRCAITSTDQLFDRTAIEWCNKTSETLKISSNAETIAMYIGVLDQNCIRNFYK